MPKVSPYSPDSLPIEGIDHSRLIKAVGEANAGLAEYNGLLQGIVNPAVMLSPLTRQEAVLSSKIEGTVATVAEVLEHEAGQLFEETKQQDIQEIINYRHALTLAQEELENRPISLSLVKGLHQILMNSVRGEDMLPGEFRPDQNWIGPRGCKIEQATFVPPSPIGLIDHLQAWEKYLDENDFDVISQTAVVHAQFELLHPFRDGNGRIGRLLIPLFLYRKGRLSHPMFYLSGYLEENREAYYERLDAISRQQDWTGWIEFFLDAVIEQSRIYIDRLRAIMILYEEVKETVRNTTHSQYSGQIVDALFDRPIFRISDISESASIPKPTMHSLIRQLEAAELIKTVRPGRGRRPALIAFPHLLNIVEGDTVF